MNTKESIFEKVADRHGEIFYCPMEDATGRRPAPEPDSDDCIEATTVGRYSGNISVVDRFAS